MKCCAYCGPDSDLESAQTSCKFLDLEKLNDDEYSYEGLQICLKWYHSVLESRSNVKKDVDTSKKIKIVMEDIDKMVRQS